MKNIYKYFYLFIGVLALVSCDKVTSGLPDEIAEKVTLAISKSNGNKAELEKALSQLDGEEKEGLAFLISYMPQRDLDSLSSSFLIENNEFAFKTRKEFSWAKKLDMQIFFNEVLPYVSLNEKRDNWRADFYNRFKKYVDKSQTIEEAIWAVNNNIIKEVNVEYNIKRDKPDQSPYESINQSMATCSGLSILLVDAFRSVGIPARVAGTPDWYNNSGNHNWVEVYVDGKWRFTEYYPSGKFDESWFLERAGKADKNKPNQWMYASSFKTTNLSFPLVWDDEIKYVYAENVTDRYVELYKDQLEFAKLEEGKINIKVVMLKSKDCSITGNNRTKTNIEVLIDNKVFDQGFSSGKEDDMNKYLNFKVESNKAFTLKFINENGNAIFKNIMPSEKDKQIVLYYNEKPNI